MAQSTIRPSIRVLGLGRRNHHGAPVFESRARAVDGGALDLQPGERVLEVGFGPGVAIERIIRTTDDVVVVGIDHSEVMLRQAARRNTAAIAEGRVQLQLASVENLPAFEERFDKIFAINSVGFWRDPVGRLESLRKLFAPGGTLVLTVQPRGAGVDEVAVERARARLSDDLLRAGFHELQHEIRRARGVPMVAVSGSIASSTR